MKSLKMIQEKIRQEVNYLSIFLVLRKRLCNRSLPVVY